MVCFSIPNGDMRIGRANLYLRPSMVALDMGNNSFFTAR